MNQSVFSSRRTFLTLCTSGLFASACGTRKDRFYMPPRDPYTLVLFDVADPPTLDPARSWGWLDGRLVGLVFCNLVRFDRDANVIPDVAKSWTISEDGLCYTFLLRSDARFSNGRPLTAEDVRYAFDRVRDPAIASPSKWCVDPIQKIRVMDDHTIELHLEKPFVPFLQLLAMPATSIVPKEEIDQCEKEGIPFGERPSGGGPWMFREWQHDQAITFERNENYWGQKPRLPRLVIRIISDPFTAIAEFETGNLAAINPLPIVEIPRWRTHPQWKEFTRRERDLNTDMIVFNCERAPFNQAEVRRALCRAIDTPLLLEAVREGAGEISAGPIPPGLDGNDPSRKPVVENPERIRKILEQAGVLKNGLELLFPARENFTRTTGEVVQALWKKLGVPVRLRRLEWVTYRQALREGNFDASYRGWFADYPDADNFLFPLFHSSQVGTGNMSRFGNAQIDSWIEESRRIADQEERKNLLVKINNTIYEESPALFLWHEAKYHVHQPWLHNYREPMIFNGTRFLEETIQMI